MSIRHAAVVTALSALYATFLYAQAPQPSSPERAVALAERIAALKTSSNVPAVGGVMFTSSSIGAVAVSGVRKLGDPVEVTPSDLWHIGSITKSFTSALIAKRVERGELSLDVTLGELLGADRAKKFAGATLKNVLSHRAGLPPNPSGAGLGAIYQSGDPMPSIRRRVVDLALAAEPLFAPGAGFTYSNIDYILLGSILEEKAGKAWEEIVREEVVMPMKLSSAGFGAPGIAGAVTQPRGHRAQGSVLVPVEPGRSGDNPPVFGPAGTMHMTIADLARWGQEHLRGERGQDGILKTATFKLLHTPPAGDYALGWVSQMKNDQRVIWHNGSNTMWYTIVAFNAAADKGVVLVTNGSISAGVGLNALAFEMVTAQQPVVRTADPVARGLKDGDIPRMVRVVENVYIYEDFHPSAEKFTTNSLIFVTQAGVVVADGQATVDATKRMIEAIAKITPKPITHVVIASDHGDHTGGNAAFPAGVKYFIHLTSQAILKGPANAHLITGDTTLTLGEDSAQILFLGRAHTGGDLSVWLPRQKILFMSEAFLNRVFPAMRSAYPSEWVATIDKALAMNASIYLPGHGFTEKGPVSREELIAYRGALVAVIAEATRLYKAGVPLADAAAQAKWGEYASWRLAGSQAATAIRKVYEELARK